MLTRGEFQGAEATSANRPGSIHPAVHDLHPPAAAGRRRCAHFLPCANTPRVGPAFSAQDLFERIDPLIKKKSLVNLHQVAALAGVGAAQHFAETRGVWIGLGFAPDLGIRTFKNNGIASGDHIRIGGDLTVEHLHLCFAGLLDADGELGAQIDEFRGRGIEYEAFRTILGTHHNIAVVETASVRGDQLDASVAGDYQFRTAFEADDGTAGLQRERTSEKALPLGEVGGFRLPLTVFRKD